MPYSTTPVFFSIVPLLLPAVNKNVLLQKGSALPRNPPMGSKILPNNEWENPQIRGFSSCLRAKQNRDLAVSVLFLAEDMGLEPTGL